MKLSKEQICLYSSAIANRSSMRQIILQAGQLGVGGVELMNFCDELRQPDMETAKELAGLVRERDLRIPCFSAAADIYADAAGEMKKLHAYAQICSELEIPLLHHTIALDFTAWYLTDEERESRFLQCADDAIRLGEYARSLGVQTVIEDQGFVFNGVNNCLRLCKLSGEQIGLVADVGNICFFDELPQDFIRAGGHRILHCHIKDYHISETPADGEKCYRTRLSKYLRNAHIGQGSIDFHAVEQAFADISYGGMYSLEFGLPCDDARMEQTMAFLTGG